MSDKNQHDHRLTPIAAAVLLWCVITGLILVSTAGIYVWKGAHGLEIIMEKGPLSIQSITLYSVAVTWLLAGLLLFLLHFRRVNSENALTLACFFFVILLYLNVLRERPDYGDIEFYFESASRLYYNEPLPDYYNYLPLWATLLEPFVPLGEEVMLNVCWLLNLVSLIAFFFLLDRVLKHYGFSPRLSALVAAAFMAVNVPILRVLVYVQVNLHSMNLIFLSLLLYRRSPFLSALALSLAVHFKMTPIILVFAFLLERDWRWLAWFTLCFFLVGAATAALDGLSPYGDVLSNVMHFNVTRGVNFRENSFDSFFLALSNLLKINRTATYYAIYAAKLILGVAVLLVAGLCARRETFYQGDHAKNLYNSIIVLFIVMNLASPLIWEHHGVFLTLPFLIMLKRLALTRHWLWYGFAYFLEFLMPTFDFFPWSYGRLLAPLIWLGLAWALSRKQGPSVLFQEANRWASTVL